MSNKMIIEFLKPHSLNMGEDFEYLGTYNKGKGKRNIETIRLHIKGVKTGVEYLLFLGNMGDNFFGRKDSYRLELAGGLYMVSKEHMKQEDGRFNYYYINDKPQHVHPPRS